MTADHPNDSPHQESCHAATWRDVVAQSQFFKYVPRMPVRLETDRLIPIRDVVPGDRRHRWISTGENPQLSVPAKTPCRFVRLRFVAEIEGIDATQGIKFQLFFDKGAGFSKDDSFTVYSLGSDLRIDALVDVGGGAIGFRLEPVDKSCTFEIRAFEMLACTEATMAVIKAAESVARLVRRGELLRHIGLASKAVLNGKFMHALGLIFDSGAAVSNHYVRFIEERRIWPDLREAFEAKAETFKIQPLFSIILPTYNSHSEFLERVIQSVFDQTYPHWELCIADDGSTKVNEIKSVIKKFSDRSNRIKTCFLDKNGGISAASNAALSMATGDFIVHLDHDDEIVPHALHAVAQAINDNPDVDWLYSDEDKIDTSGQRFGPFFKPDWSPAYFLSCMYTCHLGVYRRTIVEQLGGYRSEFDYAQDYDLALRFASITRNVVHIPDVLYSWRTLPESTASGGDAKPSAELKARRAVQAFMDRGKYKGTVTAGPRPGTHRPQFDIVGAPLVSIAIPSAGKRVERDGRATWFVLELVRSIHEKAAYKNFEIVIADNGDFEPELIGELNKFNVTRVHYAADVFNMSDKMNLVVNATRGEYVILLNDDMTIINEDWIIQMLMWAQQDDVAGVGAKLFFPDGRIQHAGVLMLKQGPSHPYYLHPGSEVGLVCNAIVPHEVSVVTGACMMVRRADYLAVGGFDPAFRINYNDVDFCMRLRETTGKRIIWTPYAQLVHYESVSREAAPEGELAAINARWKSVIGADPFYNRNLSQNSSGYQISPYIRSIIEDYGLADVGA